MADGEAREWKENLCAQLQLLVQDSNRYYILCTCSLLLDNIGSSDMGSFCHHRGRRQKLLYIAETYGM
jgi:hypothetical protein